MAKFDKKLRKIEISKSGIIFFAISTVFGHGKHNKKVSFKFENFDFRLNFVEILESIQKPARIFLLKNACLYAENAQKMKKFWFKNCQFF